MTFLNGLLAFGAAAFAVPLLIHLLNRSRFVTIDWGAMQFLESSIRSNSRRLQWKQWLLLFVRCLIPVMLAVAMARPWIPTWRDSGNANAIALAILLDDSLSMQFSSDSSGDAEAGAEADGQGHGGPATRIAADRSRFDEACDQLIAIVEAIPAGSSVLVVLCGSPTAVYQAGRPADLGPALKHLRQRAALSGPVDVEGGMEKAWAWLNDSPHPRRHALIVSDFQSSDWGAGNRSRLASMAQAMTQQAPVISWSCMTVSSSSTSNADASAQVETDPGSVVLESIEGFPAQLVNQSSAMITARILHRGTTAEQVSIVFSVGEREIERQFVPMTPGASSTVRFSWKPTEPGDHLLTVAIERNPKRIGAHSMTRVARVRSPSRVLLVDGDLRGEAMRSETDFLRLALSPFAFLQGQAGDSFVTQVTRAEDWRREQLDSVDLVAVCNVPDLGSEERGWLRQFAERGGGVLVCMGDRVQVERYNLWEETAQGGIRPGIFSSREEWSGSLRATVGFETLWSAAIWESLAAVRFSARNLLALTSSNTQTLVEFEDGSPWIVGEKIGMGRCLWVMSACDDADSNLPSKAAYVPVMHRLLQFAEQRPTSWQVQELGSVWHDTWPADSAAAGAVLQVAGETFPLTEIPIESEDGEKLPGPLESDFPLPRTVDVVRARLGEIEHRIAVDLASSARSAEMQGKSMTEQDWTQVVSELSAISARDARQWMDRLRSDWAGRELWSWFWLALVGLLLLEIAIQQTLTPGAIAGETAKTHKNRGRNRNRGAA